MLNLLREYEWVFVAALVASLVATPVMRYLASRFGVVDHPDEGRKLHHRAIPYLGGVAIFAGWLVGMAMCLFPPDRAAGDLYELVPIHIILGASIILLVGFLDDVYEIPPMVKIGGQLAAAAMLASQRTFFPGGTGEMMLGQKLVVDFFGTFGVTGIPGSLSYGLGTALIGLFVVGGCNAVNLLDGVDGLATGVSIITTVGLLLIAVAIAWFLSGLDPTGPISYQDHVRVTLCVAFVAALLGFLPYNFNRASIFMGDAGSLFLGFMTVTIILQFANVERGGPRFVLGGLICFGVPIFDTSLTMLRRKLRGLPIMKPGPQHTYVQLMRYYAGKGLSPTRRVKAVAFTLYGVALGFTCLGFLTVYLKDYNGFYLVVLMWVVVVSLVFVLHPSGRPLPTDGPEPVRPSKQPPHELDGKSELAEGGAAVAAEDGEAERVSG